MAKEDSEKVLRDLKYDGCLDRPEKERCAYHRGDRYATDLVSQHYAIVYPEGESK